MKCNIKNGLDALGIGSIALLSVLLLTTLAVGGVAAVDNPSMPYSENVTADSDTTSIKVTATNVTNTSTTPASVTVFEVPDDGTETPVASGTLNTSASETDSYSFAVPDISDGNTTDYRVEVSGDGAESLIVEKIGVLGGGGGLLGGGLDSTTLGGLALVLVVLAWAAREEM